MSSGFHAQQAVAVLVGVEQPLCVVAPNGAAVRGAVVLVPAGCLHRVESAGRAVGALYDVLEHPALAQHSRAAPQPVELEARLSARVSEVVRANAGALEERSVLLGVACELGRAFGVAARRRIDRRVSRALEALREPSVARAEIVRASALSEAHLQALFARDVGTSMRAFRLWQRTVRAVIALGKLDATSAAHATGFADLAHFSRSCQRFLGYTPSAMRAALSPSCSSSRGEGERSRGIRGYRAC